MRVALLAGGTGGAKLGAGMQEEIGADLTVIANTGDDVEALGVHVSPDPDLVTYWLSGEIDEERGWGIRDDTFTVFERLKRLGAPGWFGLSDRDLAACLYRRQFLEEGGRLTDAQAQIARALGVEATVLPMCDAPVRTKVLTAAGRRGLQEYLIVDRGEPEVLGVELEGIEAAEPSPEALDALRTAEAIVIGPSNPVISIGPILAVPGMREAIAASPAPVLAVSPYVAGEVVKGPTDRFMAALGRPTTAAGVASLYAGLIDAMVVDEGDPDPPPAEIADARCADADGGRGRPRPPRPHRPRLRGRPARMRRRAPLPSPRVEGDRGPPRQALRRRQAAPRRRPGRRASGGRWRRRWSPTCWRRSARRGRSSARSSSAATRSPRSWPPTPVPRSSPTPRTPATSRRRWRGSPAPKPRAPAASSCSPATARCSTRASSTGC